MGLLPPPPGCDVQGEIWFEGNDLRKAERRPDARTAAAA